MGHDGSVSTGNRIQSQSAASAVSLVLLARYAILGQEDRIAQHSPFRRY